MHPLDRRKLAALRFVCGSDKHSVENAAAVAALTACSKVLEGVAELLGALVPVPEDILPGGEPGGLRLALEAIVAVLDAAPPGTRWADVTRLSGDPERLGRAKRLAGGLVMDRASPPSSWWWWRPARLASAPPNSRLFDLAPNNDDIVERVTLDAETANRMMYDNTIISRLKDC